MIARRGTRRPVETGDDAAQPPARQDVRPKVRNVIGDHRIVGQPLNRRREEGDAK